MALRDYLNTNGVYRLWSDIKPKIDAKFGKVKVGAVDITPTSSDDSVTLSGTSPISITGDNTTNTVTISHSDSGVIATTYGVNSASAVEVSLGETFVVNGFDTNSQGHITSASSHTVKVKTITKADLDLDNVTNDAQVKRVEMGVADGVATLDSNGEVPLSQLPTGTSVNDVALGNHVHGNITTDGKVGTTSGYALYTTTGGTVTAGSLAVSDPSVSGTASSVITSVSQDAKGQITATKANLPADYSTIAVGSINVTASSVSDTFRIVAGNNITITPDTSSKSIQIDASGGNQYLAKAEHVYTSVNGGETTFDVSDYPELSTFDPDANVLLISVDGLVLNDDLYTINGTVVTLDTALFAGSSISFKCLGFGIPGDLEIFIQKYNSFLAYYEAHPPYYDDTLERVVFPEDLYSNFSVNISQGSPLYAFAIKYNSMLTYLQSHMPYMDEHQELIIPTVDLSQFIVNT